MPRFDSPLNDIKIASPCPANWDDMYGGGRKRFCGECKLNVYNLSGMTSEEAERLVTNAEGRLCVRFFQRADGSVITADCPVGWARIKQRTRVYATAAFSLVMALLTGVFFATLFSKPKVRIGTLAGLATPTPMPLMGAVALPPSSNSNTEQREKPTPVMGNFVTPAKKAAPIREVKGDISSGHDEDI